MFAALITLAGLFTIILITHNQMLEAMRKDASGESKPHLKLVNSKSQLHHEKPFRLD